MGTIRLGDRFGGITALGSTGIQITGNPNYQNSFSYRDAEQESWKYLYSKENRCIFSYNRTEYSGDDRISQWKIQLKIQFVVDGVWVATAIANVYIDNINVLPTRGSCVWA